MPLKKIYLKSIKPEKYYDASLLEHHGIPHKEKGEPTSKEKEFCEKYRGGKIFNRSDLNKTIQIGDNISNGYEYMWQSFCDNTDQHQTYYVLVKRKKGLVNGCAKNGVFIINHQYQLHKHLRVPSCANVIERVELLN